MEIEETATDADIFPDEDDNIEVVVARDEQWVLFCNIPFSFFFFIELTYQSLLH